LRASLLPNPASTSQQNDSPPPNSQELEERYGKLFGAKVVEMWERGGREIWETVGNPNSAAAQATTARGEDDLVLEDDDEEDDEEEEEGDGEGEGTVEGETREGSAMEE
jgi:hypothetical protein